MLPAAELILDPYAEGVLVGFINDILPGTDYSAGSSSTQLPKPMPPIHFQVMRTGGVRRSLVVDVPQLTVQVRVADGNDVIAMPAAQFVRAAILAAGRAGVMGETTIYEVTEFSGPANLPDPVDPDRARISATYAVPMRSFVA